MNDQQVLKRMFLLMLGITVLSGCSSMNSNFDCPMKPGVSCESIDKVNARIDKGEFETHNAHAYSLNDPSDSYEEGGTNSNSILNNYDKAMHIWIAPYVDKEGNYHSGSSVYSTHKISEWTGE